MRILQTRHATAEDLAGSLRVHDSAFGEEEGPVIVERVSRLLVDKTAVPLLSLVAETDGRVAGHVLFTAVHLPSSPRPVFAQILAPFAVARGSQAQGVGKMLVNEGLKELATGGAN